MANSLIDLKDVSKYYHSKEVVTVGVRRINLSFNIGEFVAIVGESGSGKSTLMNIIAGIDTYEEGEMLYNGEETSCYTSEEWDTYRKNSISFIFQDYNLIDSYTVLENVELALLNKDYNNKQRRKRALDLLEKVGLTSHIKHKCTKLSGGQKQRVAIARALAKDAPVILADEPCGNLDEASAQAIIKLLSEISKDKLIIMVTHNYDDVKDYATRKVRLFDGGVTEDIVNPNSAANEQTANSAVISINQSSVIKYFKDKVRRIKGLFHISLFNLRAKPKSNMLVISAVFISTLLLFAYIILFGTLIRLKLGMENYMYRKDTAIVYKSDRSLMDSLDMEIIGAIKGVKTVNDYHMIGSQELSFNIEVGYQTLITTAILCPLESYGYHYVEYGRLPQEDDEVLLTYSDYYYLDKSILGQEISFRYGDGLMYYDEEITPEEENIGKISLKVVGITKSYSRTTAYVTDNAIRSLALKKIAEWYNYTAQFRIRAYDLPYAEEEWIKTNLVVLNDNVPKGSMIFVYDPIIDFKGFIHHKLFKTIYLAYNDPEWGRSIYLKEDGGEVLAIDIIRSTPTINPEYYDNYYPGKAVLICHPDSFPFGIDYYQKVNTLRIVMDETNNQRILKAVESAGYSVIYLYDSTPPYDYLDSAIEGLIIILVIGLILISLSCLLISEIIARVFRNKVKDNNVLRSLGYVKSDISRILFFETMFLQLIGFLITFAIIGIAYYLIIHYKMTAIYLFFYEFIPYGYFSRDNLLCIVATTILVIYQSRIMSKRFVRKLHKYSIKKTSVTSEDTI